MSISVLLVDDDEVDRLAVRRALADSSPEISLAEAPDADVAIAQVQSEPVDCIILDHDLQGYDGLSLIQDLRAGAAPYTPIVMLTGRDDPRLAVQLMKAGATDYVRKADLSPGLLATAIRSAVRLSHEQAQVRLAQAALLESEMFNRSVLDSLPIQIVVVDTEGVVVSTNEAWRHFADLHADEIADAGLRASYIDACRRIRGLTTEDAHELNQGVLAVARGERSSYSGEYPSRIGEETYWFGVSATRLLSGRGSDAGIVISHADVSARKVAEERLVHEALHDALTTLPNKTLLIDHLRSTIQRISRRPERLVAALFLDLDHFKVVNDSLGHQAGDAILLETACRLSASLRSSDFVARLGGDEFVVVLEDLVDERHAFAIADKIQKAIGKRFRVQGHEFSVTASIGIVIIDGIEDAEAVLRNADTAMYRAKASGRSCFALFGDEMHAAAVETMKLRRDLPLAIERSELFMEYQPIVSLESDALVGFEALIRWRRPDGKVAGPCEFIPFAEDTGLIRAVDHFALSAVCRQLSLWQDRFGRASVPSIGFNLSAHNLRRREIVSEIDTVLKESGAPPELLVLELTESAYAECSESLSNTLEALRSRGIRIYIDDFGVGYSSLSYLSRLPIDAVKIDQSFVRQSVRSAHSSEVVRAIAALGRVLGFGIVAEGIETEEQRKLARTLDCDLGQGYFFGHSIDDRRASAMIATRAGYFGGSCEVFYGREIRETAASHPRFD